MIVVQVLLGLLAAVAACAVYNLRDVPLSVAGAYTGSFVIALTLALGFLGLTLR